MNPFEFVNAINYGKQDLFDDPQAEKDYSPFLVNRALSYFPDTILYANEMNRAAHIPKKWQFDFLRGTVPKRKRFSKWSKKSASSDDVRAVSMFYKYSMERAMEVMPLLSKDQIDFIKQQMDKGGTS
jgi:hypothetical protein